MNYPIISEYIEVIKAAEENLAQLKQLRPVLEEDGQPVMSSGNFAVVFKMKDEQTGKLYAVKCFLKEQEGRAEAYRLIAEELEYVSSTFLTPIKYLDKELFMDTGQTTETEFPVLLMDWVEGETLDKYIRKHLDDQYELSLLAYQFSRLAMWLMPQPFAHGDLKPDNILVKEDGTLVLVDYDGMYVPAMKGQRARELGSPDFRHPFRTEDVFDEHIDDFSLVSILLSLKAIALQPELLEQYGASDRLLFSERDYRNLSESQVMDALKNMMQDTELATLYSLFILSSAQNNLSQTSFRLLNLSRPQLSTVDDLGTIVVDELLLTKDRKRLISCLSHDKFIVTIPSETRFIDEYAFFEKYSWWYDAPPYFIRFQNDVLNHFRSDYAKLIVPNDKIKQSFIKKGFDEDNIIVGDVFVDDFGVIYSEDKTKLLCFPKELEIEEYHILEECEEIICGGFNYLPDPDDDGTVSIRGNKLKILHIPSTLKKVGKNALEGCVYLNTFVVPQGLISYFLNLLPNKFSISFLEETEYYSTKITKEDLDNAWTDEYGVMYSADKKRLLKAPQDSFIEEYSIVKGTKVICNSAFRGCEFLESILIPNSVILIGDYAFADYCGLKNINIPDGVKSIGEGAFYECINLPFIYIPDSVKIIGDKVFEKCDSLQYVRLPNEIEKISDELFAKCYNLHNIEIPNSVSCIGSGAFCECNLISIDIPNSVSVIEGEAFKGCSFLSSIIFPDSIKSIGDFAFSECDSLEEITFLGKMPMLGISTFYGCNNLLYVNVPIGAKKEDYQFSSITIREQGEAVYSLKVTDKNLSAKYVWIDDWGVKYSLDKKRLLEAPKSLINYSVKEGTIVICDYAFSGCKELTSVSIPTSVLKIGDSVFSDCYKLNSILIPNNISHIGESAFCCSGIQNVTISDQLNSIPASMFKFCSQISSLSIPQNIKTIGYGAFWGCKSLTSITIPEKMTSVSDDAFRFCEHLKTIRFLCSDIEIGSEAFYCCTQLTTITIPKGTKNKFEKLLPEFRDIIVEIEEIEDLRTDVTKDDLANAWTDEYGVKYSADKKRLLKAPDQNLIHNYLVIYGTRIICHKAFQNSEYLSNVIIPNSVTLIGDEAFAHCQWLNFVNLPSSVKKIGDRAFDGCVNLEVINIPKAINKIGTLAFESCALKQFVIPKSVTSLGLNPFVGCNKLNSLTCESESYIVKEMSLFSKDMKILISCICKDDTFPIPLSVNTIGDYAFSKNEILRYITIPDSVSDIGRHAFSMCRELRTIIINNSNIKIGDGVFFGCYELQRIVIPKGTWNIFADLLPNHKRILLEQ